MWTTVIGPSPSHLELNAQQEKSKRRFSGWAALILTHGQVHFIYYKLRAHSNTHTHAQIHSLPLHDFTHMYNYYSIISTLAQTLWTHTLTSETCLTKTQRLFTNFFLRQYAHRPSSVECVCNYNTHITVVVGVFISSVQKSANQKLSE